MRILIALFFLAIAHAAEPAKPWPPVAFKYAVAYCYDFSQDPRGYSITFPDGSLHKGVIRATTVRLTEAQVTKLRTLLSTDSKMEHGDVDCYDPHHAFVFYDADWKVTASIDVCFLCDDYAARPKGTSDLIDLAALEAFCREIGLPLLKDSPDYTALYRREQPSAAPAKPKAEPSPSEQDDPFGP